LPAIALAKAEEKNIDLINWDNKSSYSRKADLLFIMKNGKEVKK